MGNGKLMNSYPGKKNYFQAFNSNKINNIRNQLYVPNSSCNRPVGNQIDN